MGDYNKFIQKSRENNCHKCRKGQIKIVKDGKEYYVPCECQKNKTK